MNRPNAIASLTRVPDLILALIREVAEMHLAMRDERHRMCAGLDLSIKGRVVSEKKRKNYV